MHNINVLYDLKQIQVIEIETKSSYEDKLEFIKTKMKTKSIKAKKTKLSEFETF